MLPDRELESPYPWPGGKGRAAEIVWQRLGDVPGYTEPFFGSGAILLKRPKEHIPRSETVNDMDGMVCNFWRAVRAEPSVVAHYADWPPIEADMHARNAWLMSKRQAMTEMLTQDPEYFDARTAGWWAWGACMWLGMGDGWCRKSSKSMPELGAHGRGLLKPLGQSRRTTESVCFATIEEWISALSARIRRVRVLCYDFERVLAPSALGFDGGRPHGVFLDPPYPQGRVNYAAGGAEASARAYHWALEHGDDPDLRIALCGYAGQWEMPGGWSEVAWSPKGGSGQNSDKERIWFSRACLRPDRGQLALGFGSSGT